MTERISTYRDFWPYYLREHRNPMCRRWHFLGTSAALGIGVIALVTGNLSWLWALPVVGYAPAWIGHFGFEKNRPATFSYPLWSLWSDFRMFGTWLAGRLENELRRAGATGDDTGRRAA